MHKILPHTTDPNSLCLVYFAYVWDEICGNLQHVTMETFILNCIPVTSELLMEDDSIMQKRPCRIYDRIKKPRVKRCIRVEYTNCPVVFFVNFHFSGALGSFIKNIIFSLLLLFHSALNYYSRCSH
jgi:hypothetical protein